MYHTGISAGAIIVVLILIALIIALVVTNIRIVPQANAYVLDRGILRHMAGGSAL